MSESGTPEQGKSSHPSRLRAALAYAGIKYPAAEAATAISQSTLKRIIDGRRELRASERAKIVDLTGVPDWFFEHGWHPPASDLDPAFPERLIGLEREVADLARRLADVEKNASAERLIALVADAAQQVASRRGAVGGERRGPNQRAGES